MRPLSSSVRALGIHSAGWTPSALGIHPAPPERFPLRAEPADFAAADRIVALDEWEHRPLVQARFPAWAAVVEYWQVHDLGLTGAQEALAQIEYQVMELVEALTQSDGGVW